MIKFSKNYFQAIATMVGTAVGAGIFAVPYVIHKAGILSLFIYFPLLGFIQYYLHKLYAEIILSTKEKHRVPGYVGQYFGKQKKKISYLVVLVSVNLSILSYLILGGIFLNLLLGPYLGGSNVIYTTVLLFFGALVIFCGVKFISRLEFVMSIFLFLVIALIIVEAFKNASFSNFVVVDWGNILLPYGPIFFAFGSTSAIPVVCKLLSQKRDNIKSVLFWGTWLPVLITLFFALAIVGITGVHTSPDALGGLALVLGDGVAKTAITFGLLSIITSFVMFVEALRETYLWDMCLNKNLSFVLALAVPYLLFLIGLDNATKVISLTGAVSGGILGLIYIFLIVKVKKHREQKSIVNNYFSAKLAAVLALVFMFGLLYEIWAIFN